MAVIRKIVTYLAVTSITLLLIEGYYSIRNHFFDKSDMAILLANQERTSLERGLDQASTSAREACICPIERNGSTEKTGDHYDSSPNKAEANYEEEYEKWKHSPYIYDEEQETRRLAVQMTEGLTKRIAFFRELSWFKTSNMKFDGCGYKNCEVIDKMKDADAVVFTAADIFRNVITPFNRPKGQRWIMFSVDTPTEALNLERNDIGSNFNWTMTYQLDADIPVLFGRLQRQEPLIKDYDKIFESKTKHTAWFVSNCHARSKRNIYVSRMRKIEEIDIFGKCGNLSCGIYHHRHNDSKLCLPMLTKDYKFYLSFENSICKDYISEKFFKMFTDVDVIPVVRGGFDYKRYLPSNIYIDASDFESPEALAAYLQLLGKDKARYTQMLREKNKWKVVYKPFYCCLCEALHTTNQTDHYHKNLHYKFSGNPPDCWEPKDI